MFEFMIVLGAKNEIHQALLFNDNTCRPIDGIVADVCQEVCSKFEQSNLQESVLLDEFS